MSRLAPTRAPLSAPPWRMASLPIAAERPRFSLNRAVAEERSGAGAGALPRSDLRLRPHRRRPFLWAGFFAAAPEGQAWQETSLRDRSQPRSAPTLSPMRSSSSRLPRRSHCPVRPMMATPSMLSRCSDNLQRSLKEYASPEAERWLQRRFGLLPWGREV